MNKMLLRRFPVLVGVAFSVSALAATGAAAAPADGPPPGERPCHADAMKYCADHRGDRGAMGACMRENQANFSQACQDAMQARMQGQQGQGKGPGPGGQPAQSGTDGASDDS